MVMKRALRYIGVGAWILVCLLPLAITGFLLYVRMALESKIGPELLAYLASEEMDGRSNFEDFGLGWMNEMADSYYMIPLVMAVSFTVFIALVGVTVFWWQGRKNG